MSYKVWFRSKLKPYDGLHNYPPWAFVRPVVLQHVPLLAVITAAALLGYDSVSFAHLFEDGANMHRSGILISTREKRSDQVFTWLMIQNRLSKVYTTLKKIKIYIYINCIRIMFMFMDYLLFLLWIHDTRSQLIIIFYFQVLQNVMDFFFLSSDA